MAGSITGQSSWVGADLDAAAGDQLRGACSSHLEQAASAWSAGGARRSRSCCSSAPPPGACPPAPPKQSRPVADRAAHLLSIAGMLRSRVEHDGGADPVHVMRDARRECVGETRTCLNRLSVMSTFRHRPSSWRCHRRQEGGLTSTISIHSPAPRACRSGHSLSPAAGGGHHVAQRRSISSGTGLQAAVGIDPNWSRP